MKPDLLLRQPPQAGARRRPAATLTGIAVFLILGTALAVAEKMRSPDAPAVAAAQDDNTPEHTARAVAAAKKFLQGLSDAQRAKATFEFDSPKRAGWTNFPGPRNGVRMGELSKEQRAAALEVVAAVTSKEGYRKIIDIVEADDVLARGGGKGGKGEKGGGKGGKGGGFGFENFYIAFFGTPAPTNPWLVEFGGHHLGLNVTVIGKDFVLTPTVTCAQPTSFVRDGKTIRPLGPEHDTAFKLMASLNDEQRAQAMLKSGARDLVLGPGRDGKNIAPEGLKGADMTDKQRELLVDLAGCWVTILHEASSRPRMDEIRAGIKDTYFGWTGPTPEGSAAYFRVTGPTVVVEYAPQGGVNHVHTIVREPGNDYGKKLVQR